MPKFLSLKKTLILLSTFCTLISVLLYHGLLWINIPNPTKYSVYGVDVSSFQAEIDWNTLSKNNISFAFIKATEGSSFVDNKFRYNWDQAHQTDLKVGAYHFFSFDSSGETQAANFIRTVPKLEKSMPPVIDVELYGSKIKKVPDAEKTRNNLKQLIAELKNYYGKDPIIYSTYETYNLYIKNDFTANPIWIRDIIKEPKLSDNRQWSFWQYSSVGKLRGYKGDEFFIDLNVFSGKKEDLARIF
jgi:lysozyme